MYEPQQGDGGYTISLAVEGTNEKTDTIPSGAPMTVTVEGPDYRGILLYAEQNGNRVGVWTKVPDGLQIHEECSDAVTHEHTHVQAPRGKDVLTWRAAALADAPVEFKLTVVVQYDIFYRAKASFKVSGGVPPSVVEEQRKAQAAAEAAERVERKRREDEELAKWRAEREPKPLSADCGKSVLGYDCAMGVDMGAGGIALHWRLHKKEKQISFAVQALTDGYVSLGFLPPGGTGMVPSDAVIGWKGKDESEGVVKGYRITGYGMADVVPDDSHTDALRDTSVEESAVPGVGSVTTLRFRRPYRYAGGAGNALHGGPVEMNWAVGGVDRLAIHTHKGSFKADLGLDQADIDSMIVAIDSGADVAKPGLQLALVEEKPKGGAGEGDAVVRPDMKAVPVELLPLDAVKQVVGTGGGAAVVVPDKAAPVELARSQHPQGNLHAQQNQRAQDQPQQILHQQQQAHKQGLTAGAVPLATEVSSESPTGHRQLPPDKLARYRQERSATLLRHAVLMVLAWAVLAPLGVASARFLRHLLPTGWFQLHRALLVGALLVAGAGLQLVWTPQTRLNAPLNHGQIGLLAMGLLLFNPLNGWLRPGTADVGRPLWRRIHVWAGRVALLLGLGNVYIGMLVYGLHERVDMTFWKLLFQAGVVASILVWAVLETRRGIRPTKKPAKGTV
eukprot:jgi/Mesvir1/13165/Mv06129-RA.2